MGIWDNKGNQNIYIRNYQRIKNSIYIFKHEKKQPVDELSSERWLRKLLGEVVVLVTGYAKLSFGDNARVSYDSTALSQFPLVNPGN